MKKQEKQKINVKQPLSLNIRPPLKPDQQFPPCLQDNVLILNSKAFSCCFPSKTFFCLFPCLCRIYFSTELRRSLTFLKNFCKHSQFHNSSPCRNPIVFHYQLLYAYKKIALYFFHRRDSTVQCCICISVKIYLFNTEIIL